MLFAPVHLGGTALPAEALTAEVRTLEKKVAELNGKLSESKLDEILRNVRETGGVKIVTARLDADADTLHSLCDKLRTEHPDMAVLLAAVADGKVMLAAGVGKDALKNGPDETKAPDTTADTEAPKKPTVKEDPLPTFAAPCDGALMAKYSGTTPVFSLTMEDWRTHGGVDLYASAGSDIRACADGVISEVWDDPMMGKCISVEHSGKAVSVYKNLCDELPAGIEKGAAVKCGDVIAAAGESALAEIADEGHLHFEMTVGGKAVDPCDYISFSGDQTYEE